MTGSLAEAGGGVKQRNIEKQLQSSTIKKKKTRHWAKLWIDQRLENGMLDPPKYNHQQLSPPLIEATPTMVTPISTNKTPVQW